MVQGVEGSSEILNNYKKTLVTLTPRILGHLISNNTKVLRKYFFLMINSYLINHTIKLLLSMEKIIKMW